ncbi:NADH-quinone oxidoreductase subunit C [Streptomyces qinglanensis]|uniref:NADH:ubiquinone oxidoreductase subunit (Chain C) n=1 Tax=Streptomyces qinglanensis TaxID=943816 RepID=A0A1H9WSA3_9ACTN|nr:NADH-quinone oxidoreductase subunit C [Streptomyces qinglanensis]SES36765.1 NADH:ubiquinone oxidoreductase subunit (chain C) [Streptomyces qinglanensis]
MTEPPQHPGWLPRSAEELFGAGATAEDAYGLLTADVPADAWIPALTAARDELGCTYFDWLSAVDEPGTGIRVCAHLAALPAAGRGVRRLVLRTTLPHQAPALPTATGVYAGAAWHERETHEMFGIDFPGHPHLVPLLLPDSFEGHPLRKDFVLAARVAKAWPGAKEPGESGHGGPKRRQMLPPGVPDPNEWGPLKGQLPPAPARERTRRTAGDTPRRTRSARAGSASQPDAEAAPAPSRGPRRTRSASAGSASQRAAGPGKSAPEEPGKPAPEQPDQSAAEQSAAKREHPAERPGAADRTESTPAPPRSTDAPWHQPAPSGGEEAAPSDAPDAAARTGDGGAPSADGRARGADGRDQSADSRDQDSRDQDGRDPGGHDRGGDGRSDADASAPDTAQDPAQGSDRDGRERDPERDRQEGDGA